MHFLWAMDAKFQHFFTLSTSIMRLAFSVVNLQNVFQLTASGVNTDTSLLHGYFHWTYILTQIGPCGKLLTKQTSFLVQPYVRLVRIVLQNSTSPLIFDRHNLASKPPWNMYMCNTSPFSNGMLLSQLRTNWTRIKWRTWVQLERLVVTMLMYTWNIKMFSPYLESREWPWGPPKSQNCGESWKIPIFDYSYCIHSSQICPSQLCSLCFPLSLSLSKYLTKYLCKMAKQTRHQGDIARWRIQKMHYAKLTNTMYSVNTEAVEYRCPLNFKTIMVNLESTLLA